MDLVLVCDVVCTQLDHMGTRHSSTYSSTAPGAMLWVQAAGTGQAHWQGLLVACKCSDVANTHMPGAHRAHLVPALANHCHQSNAGSGSGRMPAEPAASTGVHHSCHMPHCLPHPYTPAAPGTSAAPNSTCCILHTGAVPSKCWHCMPPVGLLHAACIRPLCQHALHIALRTAHPLPQTTASSLVEESSCTTSHTRDVSSTALLGVPSH